MRATFWLAICGALSLGMAGNAIAANTPANAMSEEATATAVMLPAAGGAPAPSTDAFAPPSTTTPASGGMVVIGPPMTPQGSEIRRAPDGLFYVTAIVNGAAIRFIVDTGATVIVLRPEDARRAGVILDETAFHHTADTANGRAAMARVTLDEVVVGETREHQLSAAVVRDDMPVSLLGQSWLAQLASLTINGDRMLIN